MPRSCGLMRPSGETAQASVKTREAPPTARLPRWTRCQSFAKPSELEYWHIGETTMRLRSRTSRICNSSNRFMGDWMMGGAEKWQGMRWDSWVRAEDDRRTRRKTTAHSQERDSAPPIGRLAFPGDDGLRRKRDWRLALRVALKTED